MLCPKCRKDSIPDAIYCPYCGKKLSPEQKKRRPKSRGNGTGTAFKRGSTWTAQVVYDRVIVADDKPLKKLTRSKGGFKTRDEALRYCPILKAGAEKPVLAPVLSHYWDTFEAGAYTALSTSQQAAYRSAWKKLEKIHGTRVDQLTVSALQQLLADKCGSYYPMKDCKTLLMMLFRMAAAEGYVNEKIPSFIQLPKLEEKEREPFSETEQAALWKLYEDGDIRAAIPLLMIYTGMMPGEAMRLKVEQIDLEHRQIVGAGAKTKVRKATPIVLAESIIPVVEAIISNANPDGTLWTGRRKTWYKRYYEALEAAGVRPLSPYSCRHTTATALAISEGIAPQTIQKVMRWSSTRMLDRYAHPDQAAALEAVDSIRKKTAE
jgi:integrase